jgi:hypothetical protein
LEDEAGQAVRRLLTSPRSSVIALSAALLATGGLILYLTRGTTLYFDEWLWALGRRGSSVSSFLDSYNGHLSLIPIAIYKLLFATAGISDYVPYRLVLIACDLLCGLLVYTYAKHRVGEFLALLAAVLILLLGPAWQDILWPFQMAWMIAIAAGIGALLMLERRERLGDAIACALMCVAVASTGVGVAIAIAIAVEIAWGRRRWADAWIVAIPLGLYALWSLGYQHSTIAGHNVSVAESFVARSAAASLSTVLGLSGTSVLDETGTLLTFGVPLATLAIAGIAWLGYRRRAWSLRALTLATILLVFWILTALSRADISTPFASRYLYVDGVFVVLLTAELARGAVMRRPARVALALVAAVAILSNVGALRNGAGYLRSQAQEVRADLGALDLSRSFATPTYIATELPGYPLVPIRAVDYFAAERQLGSPADTAAELAAAPEPARELADAEMAHIRRLSLVPSGAAPATGPLPQVDLTSAATTTSVRSCISFAPTAAAVGQVNQTQLTLPRAGVRLSASGAQAMIGVRRFADGFQPLGTIPAGASATLGVPQDNLGRPWHLRVVGTGAVRICGLA